MKQVYILAFTVISFCSFGQEATLKRTPYKLVVAVDKKSVYEEDIKATAYVLPDNTIQLYPGEIIYVEVEQENGIIKSMTAVKENKNPAKTVTISLTQSVKKKVHELMMLKVSNQFPQKLVYEAKIFVWPENHWIESDVLPVEGGLSGFESWPDIIISIGLSNWRLDNK